MFHCPTCDSETTVIETRAEVRRRKCQQGHVFCTEEVEYDATGANKYRLSRARAITDTRSPVTSEVTNNRVFTPDTLAERWGCSAHHVRDLIAEGRLRAFKLGSKLWRVTAEEVERYECGSQESQSTPSDDSKESSNSSGTTDQEPAAATALTPLTRARRRRLLQHSTQNLPGQQELPLEPCGTPT